MASLVSYGATPQALVGVLGLVFTNLIRKASSIQSEIELRRLEEIVEHADSGIWGDDPVDPDSDYQVFRVADFGGDFRLEYDSAPYRSIPENRKEKFRLRDGDLLVVKSSGSAKRVVSGRVAVFEEQIGRSFAASNFLIRLRFRPELNPHFLAFALGSPPVRERVASLVKTMTYPNLSYKIYRTIEIPIPKRDDQDRIADFFVAYLKREPLPPLPPSLSEVVGEVNRVTKLAEKVGELKKFRAEVQRDTKLLLQGVFAQLIDGAKYRPVREVAPIVRRRVNIEPDGEYLELGVRSFGRGIFHKPTLIGAELDWQKLFRIHSGDVVISNIKAWEGAIGVAEQADHNRVGSHRYITCVPVAGVLTAAFLCFYLLSDEGIEKVQAASPGSADRNRTLAMKRLEEIRVPVPDFDKQLWFENLQRMAADIAATQTGNQIQIDALIPAVLDQAYRRIPAEPS